MIDSNEYFEGKVKSFGFKNSEGSATVGVMEPGEYTFNTGAPELMTLISGQWKLQLPGSDEFVNFPVAQTAKIPGNASFKVQIAEQSAYHCAFESQ